MSRYLRMLLVVAAVASGLLISSVALAASDASPKVLTHGTIPVFEPDSAFDLSRIPDFVSVLGPDGEIAGYVAKVDLFAEGPMPPSPADLSLRAGDEYLTYGPDAPLTVYDAEGNVIGEWRHGGLESGGGFYATGND